MFLGLPVFVFELGTTEKGEELGSSNLASLVHHSNSIEIQIQSNAPLVFSMLLKS